MDNNLRNLWEVFQDKKLSLMHQQKSLLTQTEVDTILGGWVLDFHERKQGSKSVNTWLNISYEQMLLELGLDIKQFEWKTIMDLWWGLSTLPFLMNGKVADIKIVDPVFDKDLDEVVESNNEKILWFIKTNLEIQLKYQAEFEKYNPMLNQYSPDDYQTRDLFFTLLDKLNELQSKIKFKKRYIWEMKKILAEVSLWQDIMYDFDIIEQLKSETWYSFWNTNTQIITDIDTPYYGLEKNTLDYILINHVITKSTVSPFQILETSYELLKPGGKIYITENDFLSVEQWEKVFEKFDLKIMRNSFTNKKTIFTLTKK